MKYLLNILVLSLILSLSNFSVSANEFKEIGIVIIPEQGCLDIATDVNKRANFLTKIDNPINDIWHIPIYKTVIDISRVKDIQNELNLITIPSISFMLQSLISDKNRRIIYTIIPERKLQSLHELVVHIVVKENTGMLQIVQDEFPRLTLAEKEQAKRYGSYGLLKQFSPQMAVFYNSNEDPSIASEALTLAKTTPNDILCKASSLAIVELGYEGNATKIISSRTIP